MMAANPWNKNWEFVQINRLRMEARLCSMILAVTLVFTTGLVTVSNAQETSGQKSQKTTDETVENPFPNRRPAPALEGGIEWLNTSAPITLKELRGKVVLIDFWTFCCINCMHVLPDLAYLEKKYPNELVVIGVHSAKFDNEKDTGNIRNAILRYEIAHPIVNDARMVLWRKFEVRSWPTLGLIDPEGQFCGSVAGEGNRELLEKVIDRVIAYHRAKGTLDETPVRFDLERNKAKETPLQYPGKIVVDESGDRLFISDSNHNRIVICQRDGTLIEVIGTGKIGRSDGRYSETEFDHPQGMVLNGNTLYVADTENHMIRSINLAEKSVGTLVGTGSQSRGRETHGDLKETALNSPWDLTILNGVLYIAMAGPHQIWAHQLGTETLYRYSGSGHENIVDGDLEHAAHAQPSGIVNDGRNLFVVDSEGSAIRKITSSPQNDLEDPKGSVVTVAGTHDLPNGRSLFEFGDVDHKGDEARFQHPLGLTYHDGHLYVADSYNHKIRLIDLKTRAVRTFAGTGKPGHAIDKLHFSEPAGLAISGGQMYIADTNNHRIVTIDMKTKKAKELVIAGLTPPVRSDDSNASESHETIKTIDLDPLTINATNSIPVEVSFQLPESYKLNPLLPVSYRLKSDGEQTLIAKDQLNQKLEANSSHTTASISIPTTSTTGQATLMLSVTYGYCKDGKGGLCKVATSHWKLPITLKDGSSESTVKLSVNAK